MKEARFYTEEREGRTLCHLCAHRCSIPVGSRGLCGVRENRGGLLYSLCYGRTIARAVDPIEKKPLNRFLPGSLAYSLASEGCNFRCDWCQNAEISQADRQAPGSRALQVTPAQHVEAALASGSRSIAYTYSEPTVFAEYALDIMAEAAEAGLKNLWVTNGYFTEEAAGAILPLLDAANVDLKSFDEEVYQRHCGGRLQPVLETLCRLKSAGVHLEVTTLIIPKLNDSREELSAIAAFIADELGRDVPWHVSRFHPAWRMKDRPPTARKKVLEAMELGRAAGLQYLYAGNLTL